MKKIVFYGKSGSGKSTTCENAISYYQKNNELVEVIKLAYPLYYLQNEFYKMAGIDINFYDQNQHLLEVIATNIRELNPKGLINNFNERLKNSTADVVINDDLRDTKVDYPELKSQGFIFVKIQCDEELRISRLKARNDLNTVVHSKTTDLIDEIVPDFIIDTSNEDKAVAREALYDFLSKL